MGFIHSALLPKVGFSYHGLVHVSDWTPTLYKVAGGGVIEGLDGAYYIYHFYHMQESTTLYGPRRALCSCILCLAAC